MEYRGGVGRWRQRALLRICLHKWKLPGSMYMYVCIYDTIIIVIWTWCQCHDIPAWYLWNISNSQLQAFPSCLILRYQTFLHIFSSSYTHEECNIYNIWILFLGLLHTSIICNFVVSSVILSSVLCLLKMLSFKYLLYQFELLWGFTGALRAKYGFILCL